MVPSSLPTNPTSGFTASRDPELHWQLTITHRGSPPNVIFQNSLCFVVVLSRSNGFIVLCISRVFLEFIHCMKIRIFVLQKFVKMIEKIILSLVFVCFRFTEISYFLNFFSNENIRKQHLSANAYSCVNMKFSYTIAVRKDEIFYVILLRKQAIFHLRLGQLFVDDI